MQVGMPVCLLAAILNIIASAAATSCPCNYSALYVFGDSISDTGNGPLTGTSSFLTTTMKPYGETYPGRPFNRFSDGRLVVDFLAAYLGLPLLNPFLNTTANFTNGVNYAVDGATALNTTYLNNQSIYPSTNDSMDVQVTWHLAFKASVEDSNGALANVEASNASFATGLYVIGIGSNDYGHAFQANYTPSYVNSTFVPLVIQKIRSVTKTLYNNKARNFLFVSIPPLGCLPAILASLPGTNDSYGCLQEYNSVAYTHSVLLLAEVQSLRATYKDANFIFLDYYGAYTHILKNKLSFGFIDGLDACCGAGRNFPHNFSILSVCSNVTTSLCSDPNTYLSWDGIHATDAFNSQISNQTFITGSYLDPSNGLNHCTNITRKI